MTLFLSLPPLIFMKLRKQQLENPPSYKREKIIHDTIEQVRFCREISFFLSTSFQTQKIVFLNGKKERENTFVFGGTLKKTKERNMMMTWEGIHIR